MSDRSKDKEISTLPKTRTNCPYAATGVGTEGLVQPGFRPATLGLGHWVGEPCWGPGPRKLQGAHLESRARPRLSNLICLWLKDPYRRTDRLPLVVLSAALQQKTIGQNDVYSTYVQVRNFSSLAEGGTASLAFGVHLWNS